MKKVKVSKPPLELVYAEAGSLDANPHNWRKHPAQQISALQDVLNDKGVGWAGACLFNKRTGRLVDGHARKEAVDPKTPVPVLVGDWSEEDERKILLTLDPLAGMAEPDAQSLEMLMKEVETDSVALQDLLSSLAQSADIKIEVPEGDDTPSRQGKKELPSQHLVVIKCETEAEQKTVFDRLKKEGYACSLRTI